MTTKIKYVLPLSLALLIFSFESKAQKAPAKTKADSAHISEYAKIMYGADDKTKKPLKQIAKTTMISYKGSPGGNVNVNSIHPTPISPTTGQPAIIGPKDNQHVINDGQIYKKQ